MCRNSATKAGESDLN